MRRVKIIFTTILGVAIAACSALTSFDGLVSNVALNDASIADAPNATDAATDARDASTEDASDPFASLLSCDAGSLVAYWSMDEGTGTVAHDCRSGFDGVFGASGTSWGTRADGGNLEFTGNGYVTMGIQAGLNLGGPFTLAGWLRVDTPPTDDTSLFWNYAGGTADGFELTVDHSSNFYGQVGFGSAWGSITKAVPTPPASSWNHFAIVFVPGSGLTAYLNGTSYGATTTIDGGALPNLGATTDPHDARFGANYDTTMWKGAIDDVRLYARALTDNEVLILATH